MASFYDSGHIHTYKSARKQFVSVLSNRLHLFENVTVLGHSCRLSYYPRWYKHMPLWSTAMVHKRASDGYFLVCIIIVQF